MALNNYNSNKGNNSNSPTVFSNYKQNNAESTIDQTSIGYTFWNSMLKIAISPRKQTSNGEIAFDYDNSIAIYLNHTKARILHQEILNYLSDPLKYSGSGIPSGTGLITIEAYGGDVTTPCIVIRKLDGAVVQSSYAYQFKTDYHYAIRNYVADTEDFDKCVSDYATIEIKQLLTLLESYYVAMTNAVAYSVMEQGKYDNSRMTTKIEMIASKLGVTFSKGGANGNYSKPAESIFNKKPATNYASSSIDDIKREFEED